MKAGVIPGGRCAVLRVNGASHNLEPAALYLYHDWRYICGDAQQRTAWRIQAAIRHQFSSDRSGPKNEPAARDGRVW